MRNVICLALFVLGGCYYRPAGSDSQDDYGVRESRSYTDPAFEVRPSAQPQCLYTIADEVVSGTIVDVQDGGTLEVVLTGGNQVITAHIDGVEDTDQSYSLLVYRIGERVQMDLIYRISSTSWVVNIPAIY